VKTRVEGCEKPETYMVFSHHVWVLCEAQLLHCRAEQSTGLIRPAHISLNLVLPQQDLYWYLSQLI